MKYFKSKDIIEYLYQNYTKVDGLWFVNVERLYGFDKALEVDREVWKIIPKLQARFIKKRLFETLQKNCNTDFHTAKTIFFEALKIKLSLDRFEFKVSKSKAVISAKILGCPWHEIMVKSQRGNLSEKIGSAICSVEYEAFAAEFYPDAILDMSSRLCSGNSYCNFKFSIRAPD